MARTTVAQSRLATKILQMAIMVLNFVQNPTSMRAMSLQKHVRSAAQEPPLVPLTFTLYMQASRQTLVRRMRNRSKRAMIIRTGDHSNGLMTVLLSFQSMKD